MGKIVGILGIILFLAACADSGSGVGGDSDVQFSPVPAVCGENGDGVWLDSDLQPQISATCGESGDSDLQSSQISAAFRDGEGEVKADSDSQFSSEKYDEVIDYLVRKRMTLWYTDQCPDGVSPTLELYDMKRHVYWGPYYFTYYNDPEYVKIRCVRGDKICYGAWTNDLYWGCGEDCAYYCPNCCTRCGAKVMNNVNFICP